MEDRGKTASLSQAGDTTESGPPKVEQKFKLPLRSPARSCGVIPGRGSSLQAGLCFGVSVCRRRPPRSSQSAECRSGLLHSVQPD